MNKYKYNNNLVTTCSDVANISINIFAIFTTVMQFVIDKLHCYSITNLTLTFRSSFKQKLDVSLVLLTRIL